MTTILFVWEQGRGHRKVAWPAVPRVGEWVELDEDGDTMLVRSVCWLADGSATATLQ